MAGAGLPRLELLALTKAGRRAPGARVLADKAAMTVFLRDSSFCPLFAKPIDGKYSLSVVRLDRYDEATGRVLLSDGQAASPEDLAQT